MREVRRLLALPDALVVVNRYGNRDRGPGLASCHEQGGQVRIGLLRTPDQVAAEEEETVDAQSAPAPESGAVSLGVEAVNVLAAAVDALRTVLFASILQRTETPELRFRRDDLREMLQRGVDHHDARWLVTLLRLLAPPACQPYPSDLDRGWEALAATELLRSEGDGTWRPGDALLRLAAYWKVPLPAAGHQITVHHRDGSVTRGGLIALRGDGPLWLLDYRNPESADPQVQLRSIAGVDYAAELAGLFAQPAEPAARRTTPAAAPPPAADAAARCAQCGAPLPAGARFCSHCGTAAAPPPDTAPAEPAFCPACGTERRPGTHFCTVCGKPF